MFYFISGYFFAFAIKALSGPNLFQTRQNNVPLFYLAFRLGSCCIIWKSTDKEQSIWLPPALFFLFYCLMNFFLFQFYYYFLKKDNAIQVSLKPELFRYKMQIHCKCIQFIYTCYCSNINSSSIQQTFLVIVINSRKISTTTLIPTLR